MNKHSRSKLPETWREDFRALIPYTASSEERDWLEQFLAHPDAEEAFEILGWESLDHALIYRVCKNARLQAEEWDPILYDAKRMKDVQKKLEDVAEYIVELETASSETGEFYGNFFELLVDVTPGLKVEETVPPAQVIPTILRAIATTLPFHIRISWQGPKPDRQVHQLLVLANFFRAKYDGEPYFDVVALLHNATFPEKAEKNARQMKDHARKLKERIAATSAKRTKKKSKSPSKRSKSRR